MQPTASPTLPSNEIDPVPSSAQRIVEAASEIYEQNPVLPVPLAAVAEAAGVSRSLIYTHFSQHTELINAMIAAQLELLEPKLVPPPDLPDTLRDFAFFYSRVMFNHYLEHGLILAQAPRDHFMTGHLLPRANDIYLTILRQFACKARKEANLSFRRSFAAFAAVGAMPEHAARLTKRGRLDEQVARVTLDRLLNVAIESLS